MERIDSSNVALALALAVRYIYFDSFNWGI